MGSVQILAPSLAKFGPLGAREFEVFDLPHMFDDYDELHKVTQDRSAQRSSKKLESKGIIGLAYWDNGFKVMSANKPIRVPADYKGLKMRVQSSKVLGDEMKALGAIPVRRSRKCTGPADGCRRWHGEPAVELLHAKNA